jgi:4-amino-4-deoxy-L-arabinose transferase-like glycosyltransferase
MMRNRLTLLAVLVGIYAILLALHAPFLRLSYFWDEAGYYIPAALDFYRHGRLIPHLTLASGHTPLVMVYLGLLWRLFGFSTFVARAGMLLIAAAAVLGTYLLGRRVAGREVGFWSALLLAIEPLFFAQSSLALLDLAAACFTTWAILFLMEERFWGFALATSLAVLSKETVVVMLPVVWAFLIFRHKGIGLRPWCAALAPLLPLIIWAGYYHHETGFWTGNPQYLQYNLYSALTPIHILRSLLARLYEIFVQGFNWVLTLGTLGSLTVLRRRASTLLQGNATQSAPPFRVLSPRFGDFVFLTVGLMIVYILMLSLVGGAILPRYMLPVFPVFCILTVALISELPRKTAWALYGVTALCFIAAWFINPPYPFPYEDNLSYADFIRLHQRAASFLETLPGDPVILTAWPATDELKQPFLGYVQHPLRVAAVDDFTSSDMNNPPRFDVLYLYSRKWDPPHNLLLAIAPLRGFLERFYAYQPPVSSPALSTRFHLKLLREFERRGQWVRIYSAER